MQIEMAQVIKRVPFWQPEELDLPELASGAASWIFKEGESHPAANPSRATLENNCRPSMGGLDATVVAELPRAE